MLYGPPRSGKTHFAGTFPAPVIIAPSLCKNELMTLGDSEIPIAFFSSTKEAIKICKDLARDAKNGFKTSGGFRTIIVDNLTVAAQMWLAELEAQDTAHFNPQRDIWGALSATILSMYRTLHALENVHVIWICHDQMRFHTQGRGREKETVAVGDFSVPGNAFQNIVSKTCIIAHTELIATATKRIYRVWFKKDGIWIAGGWFPESRTLARNLEYIGVPKHKNVHYDVFAEALGLPSKETEEKRIFGE